jgi:hypothetical protein
MDIRLASEAAPGRPVNEDGVLAVGNLVAVFDGVTQVAELATGCSHSPSWYVRRLSAQLASAYTDEPDAPLSGLLARAITAVADEHRNTCDLSHRGTPASTACLLREGAERVEYLVLCDSPLVLDMGGRAQVINDDRLDLLIAELRRAALVPGSVGTRAQATRVKGVTVGKWEYINQPGGYWIAAADPQAAHEAVTGSAPLTGPGRVRRAALLTDGASAAVEKFELFGWDGLLDVLTVAGPTQLIRQVRKAENADGLGTDRPRYKKHDDATAAICLFEGNDQ